MFIWTVVKIVHPNKLVFILYSIQPLVFHCCRFFLLILSLIFTPLITWQHAFCLDYLCSSLLPHKPNVSLLSSHSPGQLLSSSFSLPALSAHPLSVFRSQPSWQGIHMMTQYTACLHRTAWSQSIFNLICSLSPYLLLSTPSLAPDTFYILIRITKRLEKWSGNQHFWNVLSQQSWPALLLTCLRLWVLSLSVCVCPLHVSLHSFRLISFPLLNMFDSIVT